MRNKKPSAIIETLAICKSGFAAIILFSFCINLLMLTGPVFMMQVFDRVLMSRSLETLTLLFLVAVFSIAVYGVLETLRSRLFLKIGDWLDRQLLLPTLKASVFAKATLHADQGIQGVRDLSILRGFLTGPGITSLIDAPWSPLFLGVLFVLHPTLGWLAIAGAVTLIGLIPLNEMLSRRLALTASNNSTSHMTKAEDLIRNADVITGMGMIKNLAKSLDADSAKSRMLLNRIGTNYVTISAFSKFVRLTLQISIIAAGALLVINGELSPGAMIAASILMARAFAPIEQAFGCWKSFGLAKQAYLRLTDLLKVAPEIPATMPLPDPIGRLDIEKATFVYPGNKETAIRDVTFSLVAGTSLAIVGPTASGKSTLAKLIIGNFRPLSGHIRLDEMDVSEWSPEEMGAHIGYLPQDTELLAGTVRENISRFSEAVPEDVVSAARRAYSHDLMLRLPNGYDTYIGLNGSKLSGGYRQRIGLARALFNHPQLVVLDEPNANLDQDGEIALTHTINELKKQNITTIIITHRPALLQHVDKVLVMNEGKVQWFGEREETLKKLIKPRQYSERFKSSRISLQEV